MYECISIYIQLHIIPDAIADIDVGMEGKGSWRSAPTPCEPGVHYQRESLLCLCTENGTWPNPVCRDNFRVLHAVELTGDTAVKNQTCSPTKHYLVGCNVCICPSDGQLNPQFCTKQQCSADDPVLKPDRTDEAKEPQDHKNLEVYGECDQDKKYQLGCSTCECLRNNRLLCANCTDDQDKTDAKPRSVKSFCTHVKPGQAFSRDCNLCYCDDKGFSYCSTKKCLPDNETNLITTLPNKYAVESEKPYDEEYCVPGHYYKDDCNYCFCDVVNGTKVFTCTRKLCERSVSVDALIHVDCVIGTSYELDCLICQCDNVKGMKTQLCRVNPQCEGKKGVSEARSVDLKSLHGYCEPRHTYRQDCNTCHCLADGKTVRCTSYSCPGEAARPLSVEIVPVVQEGARCPAGLSYKVRCNYCFCLANGNALCTTHDCSETGN